MKIDSHFVFALSRVSNAAVILLAMSAAALWLGSETWGHVVLLQTFISYSLLLGLGINEGYGQERALLDKDVYYNEFSIILYHLAVTVVVSIVILCLVKNRFVADYYLFLPLGYFSLSLFAVVRMLYRGTARFALLSLLYIINAILLIVIFVIKPADIAHFVLIYYFSYMISSLTLIILYFKKSGVSKLLSLSEGFNLFAIIRSGFPILLSGVVFEIFFTLDRVYIQQNFGMEVLGVTGFTQNIVKGNIMFLSILNTIQFRILAKSVSIRDLRTLRRIFFQQITLGLIFSTIFVSAVSITLTSNLFYSNFVEYASAFRVFLSQSLLVIPLIFVFPLSVVSNYIFSGKLYAKILFITTFLLGILLYLFGEYVVSQNFIRVYFLSATLMSIVVLFLFLKVNGVLRSWKGV